MAEPVDVERAIGCRWDYSHGPTALVVTYADGTHSRIVHDGKNGYAIERAIRASVARRSGTAPKRSRPLRARRRPWARPDKGASHG